MEKNKTIKLTKEVEIPIVGFGTYLIPNEDAPMLVANAIRLGYLHIDTAEMYHNEKGVGVGIRAGLKSKGLSRDQVFVTTKLWPGNSKWGGTSKTFATTIKTCNASLERLGLDYIDLYLIHAAFDSAEMLEQWRGLVELKQQKKVRVIGVSNFNENRIKEIKRAGLPLPVANQIELHPWSQKPQLVKYLLENNIVPIAYSSLLPLTTWRITKGQKSAKTEKMRIEGNRADSPFKIMAKKYGVSEAQILLRWGIQNNYPVIPKSINLERLKQNINLFSFSIDKNDMEFIKKMDQGDGVVWYRGDPTKITD
jgi:2,5-diketo-D-gluconate reductase A